MSSIQEPPSTGDENVDAILRKVTTLAEAPLVDHLEVFREAQQALQGYLNSGHHAS
ncbi:MAG: hypothetical protein LBG99_05490 [Propionibacteriaceae bacterium]|jgi:hypothetical protein|nr:hypothetical protein [Propionibacteriaceae bacterium]